MHDTRILPLEEMVHHEELSGRVEILRELKQWVENIGGASSSSIALIAPRRMGKTVLLERLVNEVFFKPEYKVAPFYLSMGWEKTTVYELLKVYAAAFFRQYIAYCEQNPRMYENTSISLENILSIKTSHDASRKAKEFLQAFLSRLSEEGCEGAWNHWNDLIGVPERLGEETGTRVAVIIDEFPDMTFLAYTATQVQFEEMKARGLAEDRNATDLAVTYEHLAQSRHAPMLVSGSRVDLAFRTLMEGPLAGSFHIEHLEPLSIPDGAALLHFVVNMYSPHHDVTPGAAIHAAVQTGGHPYYLYCLAVSDLRDKSFAVPRDIDRLIQYEIENGKIWGYWETQLAYNRKKIHGDDDSETVGKIFHQLARYNDRRVDIEEIAEKTGIPAQAVEMKMEKIREADMVYGAGKDFYGFNNICLMRFFKYMFEQELEDVERLDLSQRELVDSVKENFLEMVVRATMMKFNHETLPGAWFGVGGEVEAPLFQAVNTKTAKGVETKPHRIDLLGKEKRRNRVWLCECKYTQTKMGMARLEKLDRAADALRREYEENDVESPDMHLWLVSTGGFTQEVLDGVASHKDLYASDHDGINRIFGEFGGNYKIPVFKK